MSPASAVAFVPGEEALPERKRTVEDLGWLIKHVRLEREGLVYFYEAIALRFGRANLGVAISIETSGR